jgi:hypothetical protein
MPKSDSESEQWIRKLFRHYRKNREGANLFIGLLALIIVFSFVFAMACYVRSKYQPWTKEFCGGAFVSFLLFLIVLFVVGQLLL